MAGNVESKTDAAGDPMKILCPRCKGRGVVFDPMSLMFTIGLPFALLCDAGDDSGPTKKLCPTCKGKGKIKL